MSDTQTINPKGTESGKAKKVAGQAATIIGSAGLGVAGTMFANTESGDGEKTVVEAEAVISEDVPEAVNQANGNQNSDSETNESQSNSTMSNSSAQPEPDIIEEPHPIKEEIHQNEQNNPVEEPTPEKEQHSEQPADPNQNNPVEEPTPEKEQHSEQPTDPHQNVSSNSNDTVNPDEIVEALIAEDQIDPNDIDMKDIVNFDEIGTVYTVEGDCYTTASFHDIAGNQLVMIDVDGDNTFDFITDKYLNPLVDQDGELVTAGDLTVDDAESHIFGNSTYLASNETGDIDDDILAQDIIS